MRGRTQLRPEDHHSTMQTFAHIVTLLEGGGIYDGAAQSAAERIIKIAKAESRRQFEKYESARTA